MKVVFGTVVYKEAELYLNDFFTSILEQDAKDFDLLCLNDNLEEERLLPWKSKFEAIGIGKMHIISNDTKSSPSELRVRLIEEAKNSNYQLLIMGDCDDMFSANRVTQLVLNYDRKYTFFYNEIVTMDGKRVMPKLPEKTEQIDQLMHLNYLGLSNSALNLISIPERFFDQYKTDQISIFDWYLFSLLLLHGRIGKKIPECQTYYRIHNNNLAGACENSMAALKREQLIKIRHYQLMLPYAPDYENLLQDYESGSMEMAEQEGDVYYWWGLTRGNSSLRKEALE